MQKKPDQFLRRLYYHIKDPFPHHIEGSPWICSVNHLIGFFVMGRLAFNRLTNFSPMSLSYTPKKRQKTKDFLTFSGGIEMWHWTKKS